MTPRTTCFQYAVAFDLINIYDKKRYVNPYWFIKIFYAYYFIISHEINLLQLQIYKSNVPFVAN